MSDRYIRQTIIDGWDQSKLYNARVAVIGSGPLAISSLMALSMLGFGDLNIYDNSVVTRYDPSEFLYYGEAPGTFKVDALTNILKSSNPDLRYNVMNMKMGTCWKFLTKNDLQLLDNAKGQPQNDLIIDATNNPYTERLMIEYGLSRGIPVINGSTKAFKGELKVIAEKDGDLLAKWGELSSEYHGEPQDPVVSGIIGGLAAEEARKLLMPLPGETKKNLEVRANFLSRYLLGDNEDFKGMQPNYDKKIVVIGAGSLGVHVVRGLAQRGVREIVVYDADTIEELNLNRQFDYTLEDTIGRPKASTLARLVSKYNRRARVKSIDQFFEGEFAPGDVPDAIFRCTDSFKTSKMLNETAIKYGIPLFYAATSFDNGQAYAFLPGKTPCLEEVFNVSNGAEITTAPAGCAQAPIPSVCTINMILANTSLGLFDQWCAGVQTPNGYFDYSNSNPDRFAVVKTDYKCTHFKGGGK